MLPILSPFEPVLVPVKLKFWSHSQDEAFRHCPLKWYRNSVLHLINKHPQVSLVTGQLIHYALGKFYSLEPKERSQEVLIGAARAYLNKVLESRGSSIEEKDEKKLSSAITALQDYWLDKRQDSAIAKAKSEYRVAVLIPRTDVTFRASIDLYIPDPVDPYFVEIKSSFKLDMPLIELFDVQTLRYAWALQETGHPTRTMLRQGVGIASYPGRPTLLDRRKVTLNDREIAWAICDMQAMIQEISREDRLIFGNWGRSCQWCSYFTLCTVEKTGGDVEMIMEEQYYQKEHKEREEEIEGNDETEV